MDEEYTKKIKEHLQDPRISTELVDYLPASDRVPTPLKFLGRIVGTPGGLRYAKDIHRYMKAIDDASDRALMWTIGTTEGRDLIMIAIADEATIRDNVITLITPVIVADGREKQVDTYYFNKNRPQGASRCRSCTWASTSRTTTTTTAGQFLAFTKAVTKTFLEWKPTIMHDLHEAQTYLYASTGTGPYNEALDAITVDEWWVFAKTEVMEMTKARRARCVDVWLLRRLDAQLHVLHRELPQLTRHHGHASCSASRRIRMTCLLSGTLVGGQARRIARRSWDARSGKVVVMFAIPPFWRWQTQGPFFLGFNTILNWNDLDAGRPGTTAAATNESGTR